MPNPLPDSAEVSPEALECLRQNFLRVENRPASLRLWSRVYSHSDKQRLGGDMVASYQARGNVASWMLLHSVSGERAVAELALKLGFISQTTLEWLLEALGESPALATVSSDVPEWKGDVGELRYGGNIVRRVKSPCNARNIVIILDAFQSAGWPQRILDPLNGGRDSQRLREAIRNLNAKLQQIVFRADGNGNGVIWDRVASTRALPALQHQA